MVFSLSWEPSSAPIGQTVLPREVCGYFASGSCGSCLVSCNPLNVLAEWTPDESVVAELERRLEMWRLLGRGQVREVSPLVLAKVGIRPHRTGHGIYCDLGRTRWLARSGVASSVLHTGSSYEDDLFDDGLVYHYPRTTRVSRDRNEIDAMKAAGRLGLPVFVITGSGPLRRVFLGWVVDDDDEAGLFLIEFGGEAPPGERAPIEEQPFELKRTVRRSTRSGERLLRSPRFKFDVLRRYGARCAVCDIGAVDLIDAAHLCPVGSGGSDDPRNGLPLCANHHRAFDRNLLRIDPKTTAVSTEVDLGVTVKDLSHLRAQPHPTALAYAWRQATRRL